RRGTTSHPPPRTRTPVLRRVTGPPGFVADFALRPLNGRLRFAAMIALRAMSPGIRGSLLIVVGATFDGILGPLARLLYDQGMTPFSFVIWRGIVAGAALWLLVAIQRVRNREPTRSGFRRLPRRQALALLGFIASNVVLNTSLFVAFDRIPIAIALLTFYTYPV